MKLLIIHNLESGLHDGTVFDFMRMFATADDELTVRCTDGKVPVEFLVEDAADFDAVIASGGDSTVSAICYQLRYTNIPILPFPAGTGNVLNLNIGSTEEPFALAENVRRGLTVDYDLGEIIFGAGTADERAIGFTIMAGAGYDAKIMTDSRGLKNPYGHMAYVMAAFGNPTPPFAHFKLEVDGKSYESDGISVLFLNFAELFEGLRVTTGTDPRDGMLEVDILKTKDAWGLLPAVFSALADIDGRDPNRASTMEIHRGREFTLESDPPLTIQYDGEAIDLTTPIRVHVLPHATRLYVTETEYEREHARDMEHNREALRAEEQLRMLDAQLERHAAEADDGATADVTDA